jgi:predicted membrane protein
MEESQENTAQPDITSDDRMWAALTWIPLTPLWPILAVVALLTETTKDRAFVRTNALLSLVTGIVLIPLTIVTLGCAALIYLVFFYWAYQAFQGQEPQVPLISSWVRNQGWI